MKQARTEFDRHNPRVALRAPVLFTPPVGNSSLGELLDVSVGGLAIQCRQHVRTGEAVTVLLDPSALIGEADEASLPALRATVRHIARASEATGELRFRTGLELERPSPRVHARLRALSIAAGSQRLLALPAGGGPLADSLAASPRGREALFQRALEHLDLGAFAAAREAALCSLRCVPHARHMRALLCRIDAEAALAGGKLDEARRRIAHGRSLAPDQPTWDELDGRAGASAGRRGFWSRLVGSAPKVRIDR